MGIITPYKFLPKIIQSILFLSVSGTEQGRNKTEVSVRTEGGSCIIFYNFAKSPKCLLHYSSCYLCYMFMLLTF
jgi:hypothetical protein